MWQRLRAQQTKGTGQGMVEFALVIPVLLLIVVGIFEAGRALYVYQSISSASREAARLGSGASEASGAPQYLNCNAIRNRAVQIGSPGNVIPAGVLIWYERTVPPPNPQPPSGTPELGYCSPSVSINTGDRIVVQVTGTFTPGAPMPIFKFPPLTFTATTRRTIVKAVDLSWLQMLAALEIDFALAEAE